MTAPVELTPLEWLERLAPRIVDPVRIETISTWRRYYHGDHDLPTGPSQIRDAFKRFQRMARTNLCGICVRSMADRMSIIGYREKDRSSADAMWQLWVAARMPARQRTIWRKALSEGSAYAVIGPDPHRKGMARVTIEGADKVAVQLDPADPTRRLSGVRLWHDSIAQRWFATVYLPGPREGSPGSRHYFQTKDTSKAPWRDGEERGVSTLRLNADTWEARGPAERSTSRVPVIPFDNSDEGEEPLAEFAGEGVDVQNRLNLTVLNRLTTERFQAYRQRGLMNFVPEEDPVTGLPIPPFNPGADQVWTVAPARPGDPEPKLFDLPPADTANMLRGTEADMRAFAAATTTPVYYLPGGDMINLAADAISALDAGHNAKVKDRAGLWSGQAAEMWSLMAEMSEAPTIEVAPELIAWAPPEAYHPSAVGDYVSKMAGAGVPLEMVLEDVGWPPERIEQMRALQAAAEIRKATLEARTAAAGRPAPTQQAGSNGRAGTGNPPARGASSGSGPSGTGPA